MGSKEKATAQLAQAGIKVVAGKIAASDVAKAKEVLAAGKPKSVWAQPAHYDNYAEVFIVISDEPPKPETGKFKLVKPLFQGGATIDQLIRSASELEVSMKQSGKALIVSPRGFGNYADGTLGMQDFNEAHVFTSFEDYLSQ